MKMCAQCLNLILTSTHTIYLVKASIESTKTQSTRRKSAMLILISNLYIHALSNILFFVCSMLMHRLLN